MEQEQSKKKETFETEEETWTSLTKDFCGYTSAHGLERIMSSKEWIRKAFWSLLFIGAVVVLGFQAYTLFKKYQRRPLNTLITLKSDTVSLKAKKSGRYNTGPVVRKVDNTIHRIYIDCCPVDKW